jgi:hypothetical protein
MRVKLLIIISLIVLLIPFPGCNKLENVTDSGSKLIVVSITGTDLEGNDGSTTIFSDVVTGGGVFNDNGTATLTATLLDPLQGDSTFYQDIIVDQIDIEYTRTDISNATEGVDVPFGFSQRVYTRVVIGETVELPFVLVQHVAKLESPLVELISLGQEKILKMEARCTLYGKDVAGYRIEPVVASVSVWFADFADVEPEEEPTTTTQ